MAPSEYSRELEHYAKLEATIEKQIAATQKDIVELRSQLADERTSRRHKEECESMARVVNQEPPRAETEAKIAEINAALEKLTREQEEVDARVDVRQKQFKLFMKTLFDLKRLMA